MRRRVVERRVDRGVVLPKPLERSALVLFGPGAEVWDALASPRSIADVRAQVAAAAPTFETNELTAEVERTVQTLIEVGLVDVVRP